MLLHNLDWDGTQLHAPSLAHELLLVHGVLVGLQYSQCTLGMLNVATQMWWRCGIHILCVQLQNLNITKHG